MISVPAMASGLMPILSYSFPVKMPTTPIRTEPGSRSNPVVNGEMPCTFWKYSGIRIRPP